ncbi:MAG TPA: DNA-binding protein [Caulobacteraceae bacterium]
MKIVRTRPFDRDIRRIGATEQDVAALLAELAANPKAGDVIQGLRGVRKVRFGLPSRRIGKRGGGRAVYYLMVMDDALVLLAAFTKNEKADLSDPDRKGLLKLVEALET